MSTKGKTGSRSSQGDVKQPPPNLGGAMGNTGSSKGKTGSWSSQGDVKQPPPNLGGAMGYASSKGKTG